MEITHNDCGGVEEIEEKGENRWKKFCDLFVVLCKKSRNLWKIHNNMFLLYFCEWNMFLLFFILSVNPSISPFFYLHFLQFKFFWLKVEFIIFQSAETSWLMFQQLNSLLHEIKSMLNPSLSPPPSDSLNLWLHQMKIKWKTI